MMEFLYGVALSTHLGLQGEYNEIHPYAKLKYDNYIVGAYYNSEKNLSLYAGIEKSLGKNTAVEFGFVTGYSNSDVIPMTRLNHNNFFIMPAMENNSMGLVLGYQLQL